MISEILSSWIAAAAAAARNREYLCPASVVLARMGDTGQQFRRSWVRIGLRVGLFLPTWNQFDNLALMRSDYDVQVTT